MTIEEAMELPDLKQRIKILNKKLRSEKVDYNANVTEMAKLMEFFSGRDIDNVLRKATMKAFKDNGDNLITKKKLKVNRMHFVSAIEEKKPNLSTIKLDSNERAIEKVKDLIVNTSNDNKVIKNCKDQNDV